jgi:hypothetical protein
VSTTPGEVEEPVRLLRQALDVVGDGDDCQRSRLLSALVRWRAFVSSRQERADLERIAIDAARAAKDPILIADATLAALYTRSGPRDVEAQQRLADELLDLAVTSGDQEKQALALLYRAFALLHSGHYAAATVAEDQFVVLAEDRHRPFFNIYPIAIAGRRAAVSGSLGEALARAADVAQAGQRAGWDISVPSDIQRDLIWSSCFAYGHFRELALVPLPPDHQGWGVLEAAWKAATAAGLERFGEAKAALSRLNQSVLETLADDGLWGTSIPLLAFACSAVGDAGRAEMLYREVLPFSALDCTAEVAAFYGATTHHLGMLAATFGAADLAVAHLADALEHHQAIGARAWQTQSRFELAGVLRDRDRVHDKRQADALLAEARSEAAAIDLVPRPRRTAA